MPSFILSTNILSTMEIGESSSEFTIRYIHEILLSDDVCDVMLATTLVEKLREIMRCANEWEKHVDSYYPEEQANIIHSLTAYLLNKFNGFDDRNDHELYDEEISMDSSGLLMKEAIVGLKVTWKADLICGLFPFHCDCMRGYKKLKNKGKTEIKWPRILECALDSEDMDRLLRIDIKFVRQEARRSGIF
eukprot:TRINITY_DN1335_c0_g2_i1.p1 TRINITY_DN1335_c0_g2~~TRINITY_DN1335_c0_g2_i1.p1  ORF type:complete len:190 (-),score=44.47 TRINITY_DN1335_c0_g2_i1:87-656(-)